MKTYLGEKQIKFIFITDFHAIDKIPVFRNDENYFVTCLNKLSQIVKLAQKNKCPIICGGDFFDKPSPNDYITNQILDVIKDVDFYTLIGNHPTIGQYTENAFTHGRFGQLSRIENFTVFNKTKIFELNGITIGVMDYNKNINKNDILEVDKSGLSCIICHNYLVPKHDNSGVSIEIGDLPKLKTKLVLLGHYHHPFKIKSKGTMFINPGSIMRIKCTKENQNRIPKVLMIFFEKNGDFNIEEIELKCEKNPFRVKEKEEQNIWEERVQNFAQALRSTKLDFNLSLKERFKKLLKVKSSELPEGLQEVLEEDAIHEVLRRLENE